MQDTNATLAQIQRGPKRALLWSIIPGGGQAYNKKFWKVPLVYGGLLGMVAYADFNQTQYRRFRDAIFDRCLGEGNVIVIPNETCIVNEGEFPVAQVPTNALISARDNADRARQTAYIGIFVVYALQAVEAYTDAHLQEFDISDDLSIHLGPLTQPEYAVGYGLTVPLGSNRGFQRQVATARRLSLAR
ncbi:DUF5683 domain-containing protein [Lewinella sp. 4G2]|uniref:DUF5683 domain-containing protein n=1 Tax=Lewinella sp. 4G2 TaxID=1803372 RepID=UPI0012F97F01|nr:DUF5683 domain-containing protein [Lewinella sp. 4G2]